MSARASTDTVSLPVSACASTDIVSLPVGVCASTDIVNLPVSAHIGTDISSWEGHMPQRQWLKLTTPEKTPHSDTDCGLLQPTIIQKVEEAPGVLGKCALGQLKGPIIPTASGSAMAT